MKLQRLLSLWHVGGDMTGCGGHIGAQHEERVSGLRPGTRMSGLATRQIHPGTGSSLLWRPARRQRARFMTGNRAVTVQYI